MSSRRTLENRLILACARTEPDVRIIEDLAECGPDWQVIVRKAERLGLVPLVYASLKQTAGSGQVPQPVVERLRQLCHRDAIRSIALREALGAVLLRLSEEGVPVVVLKGAALAALVYPSPALRTMVDIDLLAPKRDLGKVDALLRGMGYTPASPEISASGSWLDQNHHLSYLGPEGFPTLEVHHHIFQPGNNPNGPGLFDRISIEDFWERSRPVRIASVATHVFSPEDFLLHVTLHLSETDGFLAHVRTLCDIREMCRRYGNAIDWSRLISQAKTYKVGKGLYYSLRLARDFAGASVPSGVLTDLRASFGQLPVEGKFIGAVIRQAILWEDRAPVPPWSWPLYQTGIALLGARRASDGIIVACRVLARSCQAHLQRLATRPGRQYEMSSAFRFFAMSLQRLATRRGRHAGRVPTLREPTRRFPPGD
jgi:hypothetical protein